MNSLLHTIILRCTHTHTWTHIFMHMYVHVKDRTYAHICTHLHIHLKHTHDIYTCTFICTYRICTCAQQIHTHTTSLTLSLSVSENGFPVFDILQNSFSNLLYWLLTLSNALSRDFLLIAGVWLIHGWLWWWLRCVGTGGSPLGWPSVTPWAPPETPADQAHQLFHWGAAPPPRESKE